MPSSPAAVPCTSLVDVSRGSFETSVYSAGRVKLE